jgi:hypothetical protein
MKLRHLIYPLIFAAGGAVALLTTPELLEREPPPVALGDPAPAAASPSTVDEQPDAGPAAIPAERSESGPAQNVTLVQRVEDLDRRLQLLEAEAAERAAAEQEFSERREEIMARRAAAAAGGQQFRDQQVSMLVEAGFASERAEALLRRADELRYESLQQSYRALRGEAEDVEAAAPMQALRQEIGDSEYDRFLYGLGQPNRVAVADVFQSSPAAAAGLKPGDILLAYDGQRMFDSQDLRESTLNSDPGQSVVLDVLRDGRRMSLYVPGGPIGIQMGARRTDPDE